MLFGSYPKSWYLDTIKFDGNFSHGFVRWIEMSRVCTLGCAESKNTGGPVFFGRVHSEGKIGASEHEGVSPPHLVFL